MPTAAVKAEPPSQHVLKQDKQTRINQYTRLSKPNLRTGKAGTQKLLEEKSSLSVKIKTPITGHTPDSTKRKRDNTPESSDGTTDEPSKRPKTSDDAHTGALIHQSTLRKQHANAQQLPTPDSTPTKSQPPRSSPIAPSKGQQRLADLKARAAQARRADSSTTCSTTTETRCTDKTKALQSRTTSLHSRLAAKSASKANEPPPPSPAELARRATLQRLPDVARVLALPVARETRARWSLSLKALIDKIQQSARSPLGAREIEDCLKMLDQQGEDLESAGFVRFVKREAFEAVTVDSRCRPGAGKLEQRVAELLKRPP